MPEDFGLFGEEPPDLALLESLSNNEVSTKELSELYPTAFEAKAMLVLSAASKSLLESDFLRLGAKGKHLEGWIGGILKVVQARDPDTLEAKGHYFILFDSHEAALIYKERLEYLWQIGKAYVPGAHHKHSHMIQWSLPARLHQSAQGEDIAELVRAFTLIPPSQRHNIALSRVSPEKIAELYVDGGFVEQLANRIGSPFQVLIRLEGGRLTVDTLRHAIEEDGIQRNLPWRISDLENGILPFGKAFTKDKEESDTKKQKKKSNKKKEQTGESPNDPTKIIDNVIYETFEKQEKWYPRFVIPFMDKAEAYRFVRSWHRRELRVQMGGGGKKQPAWEDVRVINASVMW
ncbi:hypothetical protein GGS21DRAFT_514828 [Xylaria nigripes]|nr:hypothetical protein GGS21DRAFT_514828 [Xylaria nigripes]